MTRNQLIEALQDECRADRMKVEDFLHALSDLCADTLKKGEPFSIGEIGRFAVHLRLSKKGKGLRPIVAFQSSKSFRNRLDLHGEICKTKWPLIIILFFTEKTTAVLPSAPGLAAQRTFRSVVRRRQ